MANARHQGQGAEPDRSGAAEAGASPQQIAGEAALDQSERLAAEMREGGRQASAATASGAEMAMRSGSDVAQGVQELTTLWARYAEEIMRQTSEASRALLNCRSFGEMLEVQAQLLRGNLQTFLDQSGKIADLAGRIAARPLEALQQTREQRRG